MLLIPLKNLKILIKAKPVTKRPMSWTNFFMHMNRKIIVFLHMFSMALETSINLMKKTLPKMRRKRRANHKIISITD